MGVPLVRRGSGPFQISSPVFLSNAYNASSAPPMKTRPPFVTIGPCGLHGKVLLPVLGDPYGKVLNGPAISDLEVIEE